MVKLLMITVALSVTASLLGALLGVDWLIAKEIISSVHDYWQGAFIISAIFLIIAQFALLGFRRLPVHRQKRIIFLAYAIVDAIKPVLIFIIKLTFFIIKIIIGVLLGMIAFSLTKSIIWRDP